MSQSLLVSVCDLDQPFLSDMALASPTRRRFNRFHLMALNPLLWILLPLSILALFNIFSPPTPLWQYVVGLPVAAWMVWLFCVQFWDAFWGSYERLVIVANETICIKDYWSGWTEYLSSGKSFDDGSLTLVKVARGNGYFLLANIAVIDEILLRRRCRPLSDFVDSWYDPAEMTACFEVLRESLAKETSKIKLGRKNSLTVSVIEGLMSDVDAFIEVSRDLGSKGYQAKLDLLSQDYRNHDIQWRLREQGICI